MRIPERTIGRPRPIGGIGRPPHKRLCGADLQAGERTPANAVAMRPCGAAAPLFMGIFVGSTVSAPEPTLAGREQERPSPAYVRGET